VSEQAAGVIRIPGRGVIRILGRGVIRILGRGVGGSGKPRQHFTQKKSRKEAQEAARRQGGGRPPIQHNERGQKSHFHPSDKQGNIRKDGSHFQYGKKKNK
jgi:hypothetical protein